MVEASRPEPAIKEEKLKFFISKIAIWEYLWGNLQGLPGRWKI